MSKPQECQPGSETASLRRRHVPGFMQSLTHTWSGPLGARRACENGDPETHMHSFTQPHKSSDTAHSHPDSDPVASQSQEYCRPHQPLFSDRAGLGPGWFILRLLSGRSWGRVPSGAPQSHRQPPSSAFPGETGSRTGMAAR